MNEISTDVAGDNRKVGTHVADLVAGSIAENTRRSYGTALARIDAWAGGRPLDDHAIAAYFADLHVNGRAPATISLVAAALRFRASMTNAPDPVGAVARRTLSGIRRKGRERGRGQAVALKWAKADAAATLAEAEETPGGLRDAALIAVMSDALLRVGELVALDCRDIEPIEDGTGRVTIRASKTDQTGKGSVQYLRPSTVRRVATWRETAGISDGPLFCRVRRGGHARPSERLTVRAVQTIVMRRAAAVGVDNASGHSLRVGSAQSLAARGATLPELQAVGRWTDPAMPGRYCRAQSAGQSAVARLRGD